MPIIKCPECGQEVSDQADQCVHCGYPLKKLRQPKNKGKRNKVFLFIAIPVLVVAVVFLVLGVLSGRNPTKQLFFKNPNFTELQATLDGDVEKSSTDGNARILFRKYKMSADDGVQAKITFTVGNVEQSVYYRLQDGSVNEITFDYSEGLTWMWGYDFEFDGKNLNETNVRGGGIGEAKKDLATGTIELANDIFNLYLDGNCTIEQVYEEYTNYIGTVNALFIASMTIAAVFAVGGVTMLVLFFVKRKKAEPQPTEQPTE